MLLMLTEYLSQFNSGFTVFQYLTVRGILGILTALALSADYRAYHDQASELSSDWPSDQR